MRAGELHVRPRKKHNAVTSPKYAAVEVERRWLVTLEAAAQTSRSGRCRYIEDKYIQGTHLRLRCVTEAGREPIYKLGKKYEPSSGGQPTVSVYLSAQEHTALSALPGTEVKKARHSVAGGSLDIYRLPDLRFAAFEVELPSLAAANEYCPPLFVGREITGLMEYTGHALSISAA